MKIPRKFIFALIGAILLVILAYQGYLTVYYRLHNGHKAVLSGAAGSEFEEGRPFSPLGGSDIPGMVAAAENDYLKLYVDTETANIALYDKRNGSIIHAVPPGATDDPNATGINKSFLQSQISLDYFTADRLRGRMNSFDHSVSLGQIRLESLENGFRCVYSIGDTSIPTGLVPVYITPERLEYFLSRVEGTRAYRSNIARYVESSVPGHVELVESARTGRATLREMERVFIECGYTQEDLIMDMEGSGVELDIPLHFVIPMDFKLDGDSLVVSVNTARIREYADGRIETIQFMRAMGAGGIEEEGYLVIPNGSGSLIRFNNGKTYADEYRQYIYGQDPLLSDYATLGNTEIARMAFFGIESEDRTILGRVESGDSLAYLTAGISEKYNSYNYVYPGFELRGSMSLAMFGMTGNEASLPVVERDLPATILSVRYTILPDGGYSAMAQRAREQLIAEGSLRPTPIPADDIPFYIDLIGSVQGQKFFAGISYMGQIPMTRYADAAEISADLTSLGVRRQVVNYQGWFNRGYYHDTSDKIRPIRRLGRKKQLEELARTLEAQGGKLYSDTGLLSVPWSSRRYRYDLESSRYYGGGMVAGFGMVNPITLYNTFSMGYREVMYNAMSPRFLTRYTEKYIKAISRYDLTGTSLRDLGDMLASDRKRTGMIHREEAKEVVMHSFELLEQQGKPLMISGGNLYALRYSDDLINMPLAHNLLYVVDDEIPFYQMIIHGRLDYAGAPVNFSDAYDEREIVLRLIEYGAAPHFTFTYESANEMKYTGLNWMYSTNYHNWRTTASEIYHTVNQALSHVSGAEIIKHEILPDGLRRVTYSNGVQILINRSLQERSIDDFPIQPVGFRVIPPGSTTLTGG